MFFVLAPAFFCGGAFTHGAFVDDVAFVDMSGHTVSGHRREWMDVDGAIRPRAAPRRAVDDEHVLAPAEPRRAPSPRRERDTELNAVAKPDRAAHEKSWTRGDEDDRGVVVRHD